jgi:riboflavin synthase
VVSVRRGADWRVRVGVLKELQEFVVPKGSVCLDGVSLTIAKVYPDGLEVALIPTTLELTTLGGLEAGDRVNVEVDMVAKTILTWAKQTGLFSRRGGAKKAASRRRVKTPRR